MNDETHEKWTRPKLSLIDSPGIKSALLFGILLLLGLGLSLADLTPDLNHVDNVVLSGPETGHYHQVIEGLRTQASHQGGTLHNRATNGSVDNLATLARASESCEAQFALVQDGLDWRQWERVRLIGRLAKQETVFFLGREAAKIHQFSDLRGQRIGIGPEGSGSGQIAREILTAPGFRGLDLKLSHHPPKEQLSSLVDGALDLGLFVIDEDAQFIRDAVQKDALQIADFTHVGVLARQFPFLSKGHIRAGQYDPINVVPAEDKKVMRVGTLVVSNGCASRSQVMGLMTLLEEMFPGFTRYNRDSANRTGLRLDPTAKAFFASDGTDLVDAHFPWLVDIMPTSNWVHIIMVVSILFNLMGIWHRYRLWRLDANRVKAELYLPFIFGQPTTSADLEVLETTPQEFDALQRRALNEAIGLLDILAGRCRKQSLSVLAPMGAEMAYRYQEQLITRLAIRLRVIRRDLEPV